MLCVLIVTPGRDTSFVVARLNELGYEVELYRAAPVSEMTQLLTDKDKTEASKFIGSNSYTYVYPARIRASFVKLLLDKRYEDRDDVIFCEIDALPLCYAADLKKKLEEIDFNYDLVKLHKTIEMYGTGYYQVLPSMVDIKSSEIGWESNDINTFKLHYHYPVYDLSNCTVFNIKRLFKENNYFLHGHGAHAIYATKDGRKKLAKLFSDLDCPIDGTIWYAAHKGMLNVAIPSFNLFIQSDLRHGPTNKKFLLALRTDADFLNIHRQLYNILAQRYKNFILVVYASELTQGEINKWIVPAFKTYIDKGKLLIIPGYCSDDYNSVFSFYGDLQQLDFDLFIQLQAYADDKDDFFFYTPDFLGNINELHRHMQSNVGSWSITDSAIVLSKLELLYMSKYADNRKAMLEYLDLPDDSDISNDDLIRNFALTLLKRKGGVCRDNCYPMLKPCLPETI